MILVTGATGTNGRELLARLTALGVRVRAMVRPRIRQRNGLPAGVELAAADFDNADSITRALEGIESAFLVTNSSERAPKNSNCALSREQARPEFAILCTCRSYMPPGIRRYDFCTITLSWKRRSPRQEWRLRALRPNLYMQGLLAFRSSIKSDGRILAPAGDAPVSIVDVRDIAAVAAASLTQSGHEGKIYDITGPESLTHRDIAAQLSEALGKQVTFVDIPESAMRGALLTFGFPEWQADGLIEDYAHYRRGEASAISPDVQRVSRPSS